MIKIDVSGLKAFEKELIASKDKIDKVFKQTTIDAAIILNNEIIKNTPVDTGNLRNNWHLSQTGVEVLKSEYSIDVINLADYAGYVNYGHRLVNGKWWSGFHFVEKGEVLSQTSIENLVKLNIEKIVKDLKGVDK